MRRDRKSSEIDGRFSIPAGRYGTAFSLVEILVAVAILSLILLLLLTMTNQTGEIWRKTTAKIEQFRESRDAFESMTRRLSQATLNTYWDYDDPASPTRYVRQSELRFICGETETLAGAPASPRRWPTYGIFFQAPLGFSDQASAKGLENLLNTWGYFVEFGDDAAARPPMLTDQIAPRRYRYRLYEFMQPSDELNIYSYTSGLDTNGKPKNLSYTGKDWFAPAMHLPDPPSSAPNRPVHILAENVVALVLLPKLSSKEDPTGIALAPDYNYDSTATSANADLNPKNQLPPEVQVCMVAIDEASARRIAQGDEMPDFGLSGLFRQDASKLPADLETLQQTLIQRHIGFRVFTTNVSIKGAKWSRMQKD